MAIVIGYWLDIILGDPHWLYHPVRVIGHLIKKLENILLKSKNTPSQKRMKGLMLLIIVSSLSFVVPSLIIQIFYSVSPLLSTIVSGIMIYQIFATKCLDVETRKVYKALKDDDINEARKWISYLVSRDTETMTKEDIIKATLETIAENLGDGVIAPMFYILIGGAPLGWYYKSVNTLDSMVGYKNDKYMDFGYFSAKWDDVLNYIPARLTAYIILLVAKIHGMDIEEGYRILQRDKRNHASPNSAYPESAAAGVLQVQLGGKATYFGKTSIKPTMGDQKRNLDLSCLDDMRHLLYGTSFVGFLTILLIRLVV